MPHNLTDERAHARFTDPQTSHDAAERITKELTMLQGQVWTALRTFGPWTDRQLVTALQATHGRAESTWRTRRAELVDKGLVKPVAIRDRQTVWAAVENG